MRKYIFYQYITGKPMMLRLFARLPLLVLPFPASKETVREWAVDIICKATAPELQPPACCLITCDMALAWLMAVSCERLPSGYVTERGLGEKRERAIS
ncbi:hypothetical protein D3C77_422010 [compost metagenome]